MSAKRPYVSFMEEALWKYQNDTQANWVYQYMFI